VNVKVFYLLLYSTALRIISLSSIDKVLFRKVIAIGFYLLLYSITLRIILLSSID